MRFVATIALCVLALAGCGRLIPDAPGRPATASPTPDGGERVADGLIDRPIDDGTRARIGRLAADAPACRATLRAAGVQFTPLPDRQMSDTCFLIDAGTLDIDRGTVARLAPAAPTLTCETALALSIWRRQSVEPAAREMLGQDVVQIDHMGSYACRGINGQAGARPSAHSRAAAVDFSGVRLRDGRRLSVTADWRGDAPEARFMRRIRDDACRVFGTVLSPDYNGYHQDHLHLEPGQAFCR